MAVCSEIQSTEKHFPGDNVEFFDVKLRGIYGNH